MTALSLIGLLATAAHADFLDNPLTVRMAFWLEPARHEEFGRRYDVLLTPHLERYELTPSTMAPPPTPDSVFSRLYDMPSGAAFQMALDAGFGGGDRPLADSLVVTALRELTTTFGVTSRRLEWIRSRRRPDPEAPDRPGGLPDQVIDAGPGRPYEMRIREGTWRTFDVDDGLHSGFAIDLMQDRAGNIWAATGGGAVSRFDGERWTTWTHQDGLPRRLLGRLVEDGRGHVWGAGGPVAASSPDQGVFHFDGTRWRRFGSADGLVSDDIHAVADDSRGSIWFGACDAPAGALSRFDGERFHTEAAGGLLDPCVHDMATDRSGLWVATGTGLNHRDHDGAWSRFAYPTEWGPVRQVQLSLAGDGLWIHAEAGEWRRSTAIVRFADGRFEPPAGSLPWGGGSNPIWADGDAVWAGTLDGLWCYTDGAWTRVRVVDGLVSNRVRDILQDREGNLWVATLDGISPATSRNFCAACPTTCARR